jgi:aldose 1-epimerase
VPFGFGLHPWFNYLDGRSDATLTLAAEHTMESPDLLPTGKLLPVAGTPKDFRNGRSLADSVCDDVYFGVDCNKPTVVDFRKRKFKLSLLASQEFAHAVVYTPKDRPYFCVENQTCSTDAHNLYAQGLKRESGLIVVPAGKTHSGRIEFRVQGY